jgi:long-chain acyl-CoA synthetase
MAEDPVHIGSVAAKTPQKAAVILASTGETLNFDDLNSRSLHLARALKHRGVTSGGHIAILLENVLDYFVISWAAQRSNLQYTPVNWHLTPRETTHIILDSGAQCLFASPRLMRSVSESVTNLQPPAVAVVTGDAIDGAEGLNVLLAEDVSFVDQKGIDEYEGSAMFYSSGTSGTPKGIKHTLTDVPYGSTGMSNFLSSLFDFDSDSVYLCPAPLYHSSPISFSMTTQRLGGTVVLMEQFEPEEMLQLIEKYRVTHVQLVPTMFVRLLKLSEAQRSAYDLSSLQVVIHAAAPCPVEVKQKMIDWWGPIIREYYNGTEGIGMFSISTDEWLSHRGSVGRLIYGTVHILDDDGQSLPNGEIGNIWIEGTVKFEYHNDPAKTAEAYNERGWSTLGDLGSLDDEGYLYLSDRRTNLILSGGVNIYPQEVEDVLALHPQVLDVAVIGVHDDDLGQKVLAIVSPADPDNASPELAEELIEYCRERLARFKCPRGVVFDADLPRLPTGKLAKRLLKERYPS